ncbi:MAG: ribonuclease P [Methanobacteriota archaeon]
MPHRKRRRGQTDEFKNLAYERIERLFELAEDIPRERRELADRYVRAAWKLKTRYNLKLPKTLRLKFCKKCLSFWRLGESCRVRVKSGSAIITCLRCGRVKRLPFGAGKSPKESPVEPVGKALIRPATRN